MQPFDFWKSNEKKGWRIKGKPIYDWKSAYLGMNKSDPDAYLKHDPGLEFDLSDYKPKKG